MPTLDYEQEQQLNHFDDAINTINAFEQACSNF